MTVTWGRTDTLVVCILAACTSCVRRRRCAQCSKGLGRGKQPGDRLVPWRRRGHGRQAQSAPVAVELGQGRTRG